VVSRLGPLQRSVPGKSRVLNSRPEGAAPGPPIGCQCPAMGDSRVRPLRIWADRSDMLGLFSRIRLPVSTGFTGPLPGRFGTLFEKYREAVLVQDRQPSAARPCRTWNRDCRADDHKVPFSWKPRLVTLAPRLPSALPWHRHGCARKAFRSPTTGQSLQGPGPFVRALLGEFHPGLAPLVDDRQMPGLGGTTASPRRRWWAPTPVDRGQLGLVGVLDPVQVRGTRGPAPRRRPVRHDGWNRPVMIRASGALAGRARMCPSMASAFLLRLALLVGEEG